MSSEPPTTTKHSAASRSGGKFGGGGGARRGKFANKPPSGGGERGTSSASSAGAADASSTAAAAAAAKARKKRGRTERQAQLLADLDEAENIVLEMIGLASETASALSDLATSGDGANNKSNNIAAAGKKNGEDYLEKVSRVHSLLVPHADKVVAYRNHKVDTTAPSSSSGGGGEQLANSSAAPSSTAGAAKIKSESVKEEKEEDASSSRTGDKKNNMYAAKVEMRLAMERRVVLKEFLRLEKEELGVEASGNDGRSNNTNDEESKNGDYDSATRGKRRRED